MIILTNGLTDVLDEGFLKVASSLIKRIKNVKPQTVIVSYDRKTHISDHHLKLNKLFLNKGLISLLRKEKHSVLYVPFPAKAFATALRIFVLSLFSKSKIKVILVMKTSFSFVSSLLLRLSKAEIIAFSNYTAEFYKTIISPKRVRYLKTGVDTEKFVPVTLEKQKELKEKYGIFPDKKVILHVGHLKQGRNINELTKISSKYQVLLVISGRFEDERDLRLSEELKNNENIKILDDYISHIEEIYQLSDVYFFPVLSAGNCIDIPLSCLEAAACNKPVITTDYGEMREFFGNEGFYYLENFNTENINNLIAIATDNTKTINTRQTVAQYDWDNSINALLDIN